MKNKVISSKLNDIISIIENNINNEDIIKRILCLVNQNKYQEALNLFLALLDGVSVDKAYCVIKNLENNNYNQVANQLIVDVAKSVKKAALVELLVYSAKAGNNIFRQVKVLASEDQDDLIVSVLSSLSKKGKLDLVMDILLDMAKLGHEKVVCEHINELAKDRCFEIIRDYLYFLLEEGYSEIVKNVLVQLSVKAVDLNLEQMILYFISNGFSNFSGDVILNIGKYNHTKFVNILGILLREKKELNDFIFIEVIDSLIKKDNINLLTKSIFLNDVFSSERIAKGIFLSLLKNGHKNLAREFIKQLSQNDEKLIISEIFLDLLQKDKDGYAVELVIDLEKQKFIGVTEAVIKTIINKGNYFDAERLVKKLCENDLFSNLESYFQTLISKGLKGFAYESLMNFYRNGYAEQVNVSLLGLIKNDKDGVFENLILGILERGFFEEIKDLILLMVKNDDKERFINLILNFYKRGFFDFSLNCIRALANNGYKNEAYRVIIKFKKISSSHDFFMLIADFSNRGHQDIIVQAILFLMKSERGSFFDKYFANLSQEQFSLWYSSIDLYKNLFRDIVFGLIDRENYSRFVEASLALASMGQEDILNEFSVKLCKEGLDKDVNVIALILLQYGYQSSVESLCVALINAGFADITNDIAQYLAINYQDFEITKNLLKMLINSNKIEEGLDLVLKIAVAEKKSLVEKDFTKRLIANFSEESKFLEELAIKMRELSRY